MTKYAMSIFWILVYIVVYGEISFHRHFQQWASLKSKFSKCAINLLNFYDKLEKTNQRDDAGKLGISELLLNKFLKNRSGIEEEYANNWNKDRKRHRQGKTKTCKERVTVLCYASMTREKKDLLAVGKSKNSRCFRNIKKLPVVYESNR